MSRDVFRFGRPTFYRGVKMRSRLEAKWAAYLDGNECRWDYEPSCFADEARQYLPDFRIACDGYNCYLEVKPTVPPDPSDLMWRMEVILSSDPTARFEIAVGPPEDHLTFLGGVHYGAPGWCAWVDPNEEGWPHTALRAVQVGRSEPYPVGW